MRLSSLAIAAVALLSVVVTSCGSDTGTTGLDPSTTTSAPSTTVAGTAASEEAINALIQTFTKLGFNEEQARCMVEHMEDLSSDIGSTDTLSTKDQSTIEKLMKSCGLS